MMDEGRINEHGAWEPSAETIARLKKEFREKHMKERRAEKFRRLSWGPAEGEPGIRVCEMPHNGEE